MSNKEQLTEICRPAGQIEAEIVRLLLAKKGIHCVFRDNSGTTISVMESKADKAKKLLKKATKQPSESLRSRFQTSRCTSK